MSAVIKKGLDCFVLYSDAESTLITLKQLKEESLVNRIYVLMRGEEAPLLDWLQHQLFVAIGAGASS